MIASGVATMILGSLGTWLGSFLIYGLGELIDHAGEIAHNTGMGVYPAFSLRLVTTDSKGQKHCSDRVPAQGFLDENQPQNRVTLIPSRAGSVVLEVNIGLPDGEGGYTTTVSPSIQVSEQATSHKQESRG